MISEREVIILKELNSQDVYVNSNDIADRLKVSSRTVKRDIKELIDIVNENGADIEATNRGYKLIISDKEKYREFEDKYLKDKEIGGNNKDKINKLIELLVTNKYINQDRLADKLFISRSTISKLINEVKNELLTFNIKLSNKPHYGYFIEGREIDIRNCMVRYVIQGVSKRQITVSKELEGYTSAKCLELAEEITNVFKKEKLIKTDIEIAYIVKYAIVSAFRCNNGYNISLDGNLKFSLENKIVAVAKDISKIIADRMGVDLKLEDIFYIAYLIGNSYEELRNIQSNNVYFSKMVVSCLNKIKKVYNIDFFKDDKLISGLENHLYASCFRYYLNATLGNPLISKIKSKYTQAYNYSILCSQILLDEYNIKVSEDDLGYIALHFAASLERDVMNNKVRVIIVCSSGVGTAELIKSRIMKNMPNISVVGVYPEYMLDVLDLDDIDLIISTVETINLGIDKDIVNVSPLLLREDIDKLAEHISKQREYDYLDQIMKDNLFFCNIKAETKEDAIKYMSEQLIELEVITSETAEAIIKREQISPTEINELVAIPHCIAKTGKESAMAIGILEKPILWDRTFVQLIFLGSLDPEVRENRNVFTMVYKLTKKKEKVKELAELKDIQSFKDKLFLN